jgi:hypothetical protein
MTTTEWLALWTLVLSGTTLLTYLGQLVVLILVYRRVIKETDRNAKVRTQEIEKAGEMVQEMLKGTEQRLNRIATHNAVGMALMGLCLAAAYRIAIYKLQTREKTPERP